MARRKKRRFAPKGKEMHFHLVHRSQRDPLIADNDASPYVLVPDKRTEKRLAEAAARHEAALVAEDMMYRHDELREYGRIDTDAPMYIPDVRMTDDYSYSDDDVDPAAQFADAPSDQFADASADQFADAPGDQFADAPSDQFADVGAGVGGGGVGGAGVGAGVGGAKKAAGTPPVPARKRLPHTTAASQFGDASGDTTTLAEGGLEDLMEEEFKRVDNYAMASYFGRPDDDYDYSQHLRDFADDGEFIPATNRHRPDTDVFVPTKRIQLDKIDPVTGLPLAVLASTQEEDVGLLNRAAPMPDAVRMDLPFDLVQALEDEGSFDELDDDFIVLANASDDEFEHGGDLADVPSQDGGQAWHETPWAREYMQRMGIVSYYEEAGDNDSDVDSMEGDTGFAGGAASISSRASRRPGFDMVRDADGTMSVTSSVARPRPGLHEVMDEKLEVMMDSAYTLDQIGDLDFDPRTKGRMTLDALEDLMDETIALGVPEQEFGHRDQQTADDAIREAILAGADRAAEEDANMPSFDEAAFIHRQPAKRKVEWDVESVRTFSSNISNHPHKVPRRKTRPRKAVAGAKTTIALNKHGMPLQGLPMHRDSHTDDAAGDEGAYSDDYTDATDATDITTSSDLFLVNGARPRNETREEKRARKKALKAERRAARERKKAVKNAFKQGKKEIERNPAPKHVPVVKY